MALPFSSLEYFGIEEGNRHFSICGHYLVDFEGISLLGHLGNATELFIGNAIEELCDGCFFGQIHLSAVSFESNSRLRRIGDGAFFGSSLRSIVIPSRVEIIEADCFRFCWKLLIVTFESNSRLSVIGDRAFGDCSALKIVRVPSCIERIAVNHFGAYRGVALLMIESGRIIHPRRTD
jgi:hypothetical protein